MAKEADKLEKLCEIDKLKNWTAITLGPRILRTEVAPLYIMSAISYELELGD